MGRTFARTGGDWALAKALFGLTRLVGTLPIDRALDAAHALGTRLGPRAARHRLVLDNLAVAMPELDADERERIGREMWGHQARLVIEAAFPDRLFDLSGARPRVEIVGAEFVSERAAAGRATLFFTGHTGCFEFLPAASKALGYPMATLFRPPNNRFIAERLAAQRQGMNDAMVATTRGAAAALHRQLVGGGGVGVLVDQKFQRGVMVPFFGRPAPSNPLVARLAERTNGEIVPARCVRLPENRYRIEVSDPMQLPIGDHGKPDVEASLAIIHRIVEGWVREHPEQWMWFHRRWG